MAPRLEFKAISKVFGTQTALDSLTLALEPGEILGFLGPNGAGKTTAIHLALGFLRPTSGTGSLMGKPFGDAPAHARLGFVPDVPVFFAESASSSIKLAAQLNGVRDAKLAKRIRDLLSTFNLPANRSDARKFSRGMHQRLGLAQAFINDPDLLILDEPASALDPVGVQQVRELLRDARHAGKSIFFSSHQLSEVEQICDRIAFLHQGRLLRSGTLQELLVDSGRVEAQFRGISRTAADAILGGSVQVSPGGGYLRLCFPAAEQRRIVETIWDAGGELVSLMPLRRSLEDLFVEWSQERNSPGDRGPAVWNEAPAP